MHPGETIRTRWQAFVNACDPRRHLQQLFERLDPVEAVFVRRQVSLMSQPFLQGLAVTMNFLGNGWLYPIMALGLFVMFDRQMFTPIFLVAGASTALAHMIYPMFKRYIARQRPIYWDVSLTRTRAPLDQYSCPSGHAMTATAAFLSLTHAQPILGVGLAPLWLMLAWARVAVAHHYPSDILVGAVMGAASELVCVGALHRFVL
jgi:membrane-associated phospholipid phosphatase